MFEIVVVVKMIDVVKSVKVVKNFWLFIVLNKFVELLIVININEIMIIEIILIFEIGFEDDFIKFVIYFEVVVMKKFMKIVKKV